jgi:hypothetical protein
MYINKFPFKDYFTNKGYSWHYDEEADQIIIKKSIDTLHTFRVNLVDIKGQCGLINLWYFFDKPKPSELLQFLKELKEAAIEIVSRERGDVTFSKIQFSLSRSENPELYKFFEKINLEGLEMLTEFKNINTDATVRVYHYHVQ